MTGADLNANRKRALWRFLGLALVILLLLAFAFLVLVRRRIPPQFSKDVRAGLAAREIQDPDKRLEKYYELRYGPLSDPLVRQQVFLDYFNLDHIRVMQLMVKHSPDSQRPGTIAAAARWVEGYRKSLTPEERAALRTKFQSPEGVTMLRRATALYNSQDVQYRGQTAPVISELLKTIGSLQAP